MMKIETERKKIKTLKKKENVFPEQEFMLEDKKLFSLKKYLNDEWFYKQKKKHF